VSTILPPNPSPTVEEPSGTEAPPPSASPVFLGVVGLALMLLGWYASQWSPPRPAGPLEELRRLAQADDQLLSRLDRFAPPYRPLAWPGRLGIFLGAGLFVLAGVRMYHNGKVEANTAGENSNTPGEKSNNAEQKGEKS